MEDEHLRKRVISGGSATVRPWRHRLSRFVSALDYGMVARFAPCGPETQVDGGWLVFVQIRIPKGMEMQIYVPFE